MNQFSFSLIISLSALFSMSCTTQKTAEKVFRHPAPATIDTNLVLPPAWAFGILYGGYTNQEQTIQRIKEIQQHRYPIDAYWIDSWFWSFGDKGMGPKKFIDFVGDTVAFPNRTQMWSFMQKNHIKGGFWIWDCILKTGNEQAFNDFSRRGYFSSTFINKNSWHNHSTSTAINQENDKNQGTLCGNIDFDNPDAVRYFKSRMKHFFDEGADFIKLDRTSKISVCQTMFEMSQELGKETRGRGFMLSHTGGMESPEYKKYPAKWTDDTRSDWSVTKPTKKFNPWVPKVAFQENIVLYTNPENKSSQIPFLTNDLGGFDMGITDKLDEELYIRWLEFSMFCPITEVFSQPENPSSNLAWKYSDRADSIFRFYAHLRMQLFPYLYTAAHQSRLMAKNMIRPIEGQLYEFMLGDNLLIAPVHEQGATAEKVYLPEGTWINYRTNEKLTGPSEQLVSAPIEQIPIFVREGAIIPLRNYASSIEAGNNDTLLLNIYPAQTSSFSMIEDDGSSTDYLKGMYAETQIECNRENDQLQVVINPVSGSFSGMKPGRTWNLKIHMNEAPEKVWINKKLTMSGFDKAGKVLSFSFNTEKQEKTTIIIK